MILIKINGDFFLNNNLLRKIPKNFSKLIIYGRLDLKNNFFIRFPKDLNNVFGVINF